MRNILSGIAGGAAVTALTACISASPFHAVAMTTPEFRPERFFEGATHGDGILVQRFKPDRKVSVEGRGTMLADGSFRLDQSVTYADGSKEERSWTMKQTGNHTYTATLSDASGPVTGNTEGNLFRLRYLLRQPAVYMDQELFLQPDGKTVLNVATVTVLGIPWARLSETITRDTPVRGN
ncbi:MAG: DUF3833 domain-containing protein [Gemmatimonadota bacterium]|nr:DUF3833 domain-containing protein [Gemmatimonadota bacterium]